MCGDLHLDQRPAFVALLSLRARLAKGARAPRHGAPILRNVPGSRFTNHESLLTNHLFLIGFSAIRNRRNTMKTNGGLSF
jgi:hypothetical protein